jgi:hypothetical protein
MVTMKRDNIAAKRQCDGQVKACSAPDLGFAEVIENECVSAQFHRNPLTEIELDPATTGGMRWAQAWSRPLPL